MLGFPMFASPVQAFWYPLALLLRAIPHSYNVYEASACVIAAAGAFGLARAVTGSTPGALVAGFTYSLCGFEIGHMGHTDLIEPAAWVPYIFWGLSELREHPSPGWLTLSSVALALTCLAGQPQIFVYSAYVAIAFVLVSARGAPGGAMRYLERSGFALALGVALAAIAILPALELAISSVRASMSYDGFLGYALPAGDLALRLFFPYLLGGRPLPPYSNPYDVGSFAEMSLYVGLTTLALACLGVVCRRADRNVRFWLVVAIVALALTCDGPLQHIAYLLPGYNLFRAPGRHGLEFALAISVLAAFGTAAIASGRANAARVAACCGVVALAVVVAIAWLAFTAPQLSARIASSIAPATISFDALRNAAVWIPVLGLVVGSCVLLIWSRRPHSRVWASLAVAAVAAELGSFGWFAYWNSGAFSPSLLEAPQYADRLRAQLAPGAQRLLTPRTDHLGTGIAPNLNLLWDIAGVRGYVPLELARTAGVLPLQTLDETLPLLAPADRRLDAAGVRFIVVPGDAPATMAAPLLADPKRFRELSDTGADHVFENVRAFPRAWIVHATQAVSADGARTGFIDPTFDARSKALVEELHDTGLAGASSALSPSSVPGETLSIRMPSPERMELAVDCASDCFVVTSDVVYPGWGATLDGATRHLYTADYVFRGVFVPAGKHEVVFTFRPLSLAVGTAITLAALLAIVAGFRPHARRTFFQGDTHGASRSQ
jgi:hypothetical protein